MKIGALKTFLTRAWTGEVDQVVAPRPGAPDVLDTHVVKAPVGLKNSAYDGWLVGGDGRAYAPDTPLNKIPPTAPKTGKGKGLAILINGVGETERGVRKPAQMLADKTGHNVLVLYNATTGPGDVLQAFHDLRKNGDDPPVKTLANILRRGLKDGSFPTIYGYSQGSAQARYAASIIIDELKKQGLTMEQRKQALAPLKMMFVAPVVWHMPPELTHVALVENLLDVIPDVFGPQFPALPWIKLQPGTHETRFFGGNPFWTAHSFNTYASHIHEPVDWNTKPG